MSIIHFDFFQNPADFFTFKPFINGFEKRYGKKPNKCCADLGYGSEENYDFMKISDIEPFVMFNYFHKEQKKSFKDNAFLAQNLYYNKENDYFVCPIGHHMEKCVQNSHKSPVFEKDTFIIIFFIPKFDSALCQKKFSSQNLKIAA
jgi:hypothetical protein